LRHLEIFRMRSLQLYLAHAKWDWSGGQGRQERQDYWLEHSDQALSILLQMGDEFCRFLTLPTYSGTRQLVFHRYIQESRQIIIVAYRLFNSCLANLMTNFSLLCEVLKRNGLELPEAVRIRRWEIMIGRAFEDLRLLKTYRNPRTLHNFGLLSAIFLPAFFAPYFVQLARNTSFKLGIAAAVLSSFAFTSLFEVAKMLDDPFVNNNRVVSSFDGIGTYRTCLENVSSSYPRFSRLELLRVFYFPFVTPSDVQGEFDLFREDLLRARKKTFPSAPLFEYNHKKQN